VSLFFEYDGRTHVLALWQISTQASTRKPPHLQPRLYLILSLGPLRSILLGLRYPSLPRHMNTCSDQLRCGRSYTRNRLHLQLRLYLILSLGPLRSILLGLRYPSLLQHMNTGSDQLRCGRSYTRNRLHLQLRIYLVLSLDPLCIWVNFR